MQHPRIFGRGHIGRRRTNIEPSEYLFPSHPSILLSISLFWFSCCPLFLLSSHIFPLAPSPFLRSPSLPFNIPRPPCSIYLPHFTTSLSPCPHLSSSFSLSLFPCYISLPGSHQLSPPFHLISFSYGKSIFPFLLSLYLLSPYIFLLSPHIFLPHTPTLFFTFFLTPPYSHLPDLCVCIS